MPTMSAAKTYTVLEGPSREWLDQVNGRGRDKSVPFRDKSAVFKLQTLDESETIHFRMIVTKCDEAPDSKPENPYVEIEGYYHGRKLTGLYLTKWRTGSVTILPPKRFCYVAG